MLTCLTTYYADLWAECWDEVFTYDRRAKDDPRLDSRKFSFLVIDDTLPGGPRECAIVYNAPFDRCDREQDYEIVWTELEWRLGVKGSVYLQPKAIRIMRQNPSGAG